MVIFNTTHYIHLIIAVMVTATLVGCGDKEPGQTSNSTVQSKQDYSITALDLFVSTGLDNTYEVDLSSKVFTEQGAGFQVTEVDVLSKTNNCQIQSITKSGFIVQASEAKVCDYRYYVQATHSIDSKATYANEVSTSAIGRVAVSAEPDGTILTPLSATTLVDTTITFNIEEALLNVGYVLSENYDLVELTLPFSTPGSVQQDLIDDRVFDYTPALGYTGVDRILYSFEDPANNLVLMGSIDIAIGYHANQGFTVEYNGTLDERVNVNELVDIDISQFVSSDDGDDYQLVYVNVFNAIATSKDPDNTANKAITFKANRSGYYYVSFAVSDHNGAYEMGLFRVEVVDPSQSARWDGIHLGVDYFTPPPTALDALGSSVPYTSTALDSGYEPAIEMAQYSLSSALRYCASLDGNLATPKELDALRADTNVSLDHDWPTQSPYLAYNPIDDAVLSYQMPTGPILNVVDNSAFYVTCVKQGVIEVLAQSDTEAIANGIDTAVVSVKVVLAGSPAEGVNVYAESDSNDVMFSDRALTGSDGVASFILTSLKSENVQLTVSYNGVKTSHTVQFIGDEKTAQLTSEATQNFAFYTSQLGNQITARLNDENVNPVVGYQIDFTVTPENHPDTSAPVLPIISNENTETDANGEQRLRIKWDPSYITPSTGMTFSVKSSYLTTEGNPIQSLSNVTFTAPLVPICGGQLNDTNPENAKGACLKVISSNNGLWFTSSPSLAALTLLEYEKQNTKDNEGRTYASIYNYTEYSQLGPSNGQFAKFRQDGVNVLPPNNSAEGQAGSGGQLDRWCQHLATIYFAGRESWRRPTKDELFTFASEKGDLFIEFGWPVGLYTWTSTLDEFGYNYYVVNIQEDIISYNIPDADHLASCVSD
ncbi:hypothetical protein A1QM_11295 [Vibrio genomosp. F10 str. 9ZC157]|nr:hypothetical protein A1QM_11295 [Vibrio genomosp. F10 str. 9ZC157]